MLEKNETYNVQTRKINKVLEYMHLLTYSFHFGSRLLSLRVVTGSLALSAINLETGISEPHQQIYHVTSSYGQVTMQWAAANGFTDFSACKFTHNSTAIH